jgi:cytochrome c oxidase assembly factor 2
VAYADGEMPDGSPQRRRRRRKTVVEGEAEQLEVLRDSAVERDAEDVDEVMGARKPKRECPVPKPGGLVGEILGFKGSSSGGMGERPP